MPLVPRGRRCRSLTTRQPCSRAFRSPGLDMHAKAQASLATKKFRLGCISLCPSTTDIYEGGLREATAGAAIRPGALGSRKSYAQRHPQWWMCGDCRRRYRPCGVVTRGPERLGKRQLSRQKVKGSAGSQKDVPILGEGSYDAIRCSTGDCRRDSDSCRPRGRWFHALG